MDYIVESNSRRRTGTSLCCYNERFGGTCKGGTQHEPCSYRGTGTPADSGDDDGSHDEGR